MTAVLGLRGHIDAFELEGQAIHRELDGGGNTALNLAGRCFFASNFAVGAEYEFSDDAQTFAIGLRFNFQ